MYERMLKAAKIQQAKLTVCDIEYVFENGTPPYILKGIKHINNIKLVILL